MVHPPRSHEEALVSAEIEKCAGQWEFRDGILNAAPLDEWCEDGEDVCVLQQREGTDRALYLKP